MHEFLFYIQVDRVMKIGKVQAYDETEALEKVQDYMRRDWALTEDGTPIGCTDFTIVIDDDVITL